MPGWLIPLGLGLLRGGVAAGRVAASSGARAAGSTTARRSVAAATRKTTTAAKKTTKKTAAKKTSKRAPATKTTTAKRTPAKRTPAAKTTPPRRTSGRPPIGTRDPRGPAYKDLLTRGEMAERRANAASRAAMKRGDTRAADKAAARAIKARGPVTPARRPMNRPTRILKKTAISTGATSLAYEGGRYVYKRSTTRSTKNQMPIRPRNWNPNK